MCTNCIKWLCSFSPDKFIAPTRPIERPFRLCIGDIFKGMGAGFSVTGKVGSGAVRSGDKVLMLPSGDAPTVKGNSSVYGYSEFWTTGN